MQVLHLKGDPLRLLLGIRRMVTEDAFSVRQRGDQILLDSIAVFGDQRVRGLQNLRRGAVIFRHQDRLCAGVVRFKLHQVLHVRAAPGVDRLVRVAHDEEIFVVAAEHLHQLILQAVNVLKLVDHDVFQPLLPLEADLRILLKDVEGEFDQIVVVEREAFLLLVEIAVEDDLFRRRCVQILFVQRLKRHGDHVKIIIRVLEELLNFDHISRVREGHIPQRQPALLIDDGEHGVDVGVVQHEKALRILHGVAVLLQDGHAEAVEGVDIAGVVVAGEIVDALAHLIGGLVREGDAENVAGQNAHFVHEKGKAVGEGSRLAGARARDHAHEALRRRHSLQLRRVQICLIHFVTSDPICAAAF